MEDRRATKNTFQRGVTQEELDGYIPLERGVPKNYGIPRISPEAMAAFEATQGIPMPGPGWIEAVDPNAAPKCVAITKKGAPCRAYAGTDSDFCVGHAPK